MRRLAFLFFIQLLAAAPLQAAEASDESRLLTLHRAVPGAHLDADVEAQDAPEARAHHQLVYHAGERRAYLIGGSTPRGDSHHFPDEAPGKYVLHLFDTFGASYSRTLGIGTRRGDAVEFLFDYPAGMSSNTFEWDAASGQWRMVLRQQEANGKWKDFAVKTLTRR